MIGGEIGHRGFDSFFSTAVASDGMSRFVLIGIFALQMTDHLIAAAVILHVTSKVFAASW